MWIEQKGSDTMTEYVPHIQHALVPIPPRQQALVPAVCEATVPGEAFCLLGAGVDTVEFSFDVAISEAMWDQLEAERITAQVLQQTRKAVHCPDWLGAQISPTGARGGYHFLLETPTFAVKLLRGIPNRPPIYVEMRAFGLHTAPGSEVGACEAACTYLREVLLADQDPTYVQQAISLGAARCSRFDLYLDWQGGWHPAFESDDERCFVKRVHATVDRFSCDGQVTGYAIGTGELRGRIYNKTLQVQKAHCEWYAELLAQRAQAGVTPGYDPTRDVWRLEFQLRRAGVKGFRLWARPEADDPDEVIDAELEAEDLPHVHSVRKAFVCAARFWAYLTRRWLRLVVPTQDPNRGRWPEHPTWAALREGFAALALQGGPLPPDEDGAAGLELVRATRYTGYRRLLDRMAVGVVTTLEAMDTDPGAAVVSYVASMHRLAGRIRRQQKLRQRAWQEAQEQRRRQGQPEPLARELRRGMGAHLDRAGRAQKVEQLLEMALGVFTSAGVVHLQLAREADLGNVSDLLLYSLEELEGIAAAKGGIRALLNEKWCKVYKAASPRGMFAA